MNVNLLFDIPILTFASLGCLTSLMLIILIFIHIRPLAANVPLILTCNTALAALMCCAGLLDLYADLTPTVFLVNRWCIIRAYLLQAVACALYHSYVLQAVFRFCRIVFHKRKKLQSLNVACMAITIQWFSAFLFILPNFFLGDFEYLPSEYHCQVPLTSFRGLLMIGFVVYFIPIGSASLMYIYVIRYIRRTSQRLQNRQRANQRDITILKRILILLMIFSIICLPSVLLWLIHLITDYLPPLSHSIEWLTVSISTSFVPVALALITPQIRHMIKKNHRQVHNNIVTIRILNAKFIHNNTT